jgi:hypothetical protein
MSVYEYGRTYTALFTFKATQKWFTDGTRSFQLASLILVWLFKPVRFKASRFQGFRDLRRRESKQVTNGSKTAVMDVIDFLFVSLGSSTVQLRKRMFRDAFSTKWRPCLRSIIPKSRALLSFSCAQKDSWQRIFTNKYFLFTLGSVCRVKRFHFGDKISLMTWRILNWGVEVAERRVKRLQCCGFQRTDKAMGQVYRRWWRICREINTFSGSNISWFAFISLFDLFTDSPSHLWTFRRTPSTRGSACHKKFYLHRLTKTHNKRRETSMGRMRFETMTLVFDRKYTGLTPSGQCDWQLLRMTWYIFVKWQVLHMLRVM